MYAIIETGGNKQHRVEEGDVIDIELLGSSDRDVSFPKVLLLHDGKAPQVGQPYVANCVVRGELLTEVKGPKVIAFKFKPCKRYRRTVGHRQRYARVKITKIEGQHGS
jgi:large subunit ribosomal protein L21